MTQTQTQTQAEEAARKEREEQKAQAEALRRAEEKAAAPKNERREQMLGERRRRRPIGRNGNMRLSLPSKYENDPDYSYRWALDKPGRLDRLTKDDDYDFVIDDDVSQDERNTSGGKRIERHGDVDKFGNPVRHFLVRKPRAYYEADQREKQARQDRVMTAIKRGKTENSDGKPIHDDGSYVPTSGINIAHGDYQP